MNTQIFRAVLSLAALSVVASGCGDRTPDDYKSQHDAENRQKAQAAVGVYTGMIVSSADHRAIMPVAIALSDQCIAPSTTSGIETSLCIKLTPLDQKVSIAFSQVGLDVNRMEFAGATEITGRGKVEIRGTVVGNTLSGTLKSNDQAEGDAEFQLTRGGAQASISGERVRPADPVDASDEADYEGDPKALDGNPTVHIRMIVAKETTVPEQSFLDRFLPTRFVAVTFTFPHGSSATILHVTLDRRENTLAGESAGLKVSCSAKSAGWDCALSRRGVTGGKLFQGLFTPSAGVL
jgi:hypothetical protein